MGEGIHTITATSRADRDIDKGLNRQEKYTISRLEKQIRNLEAEEGYLVGSDGKVIGKTIRGNKSSAEFLLRDMLNAKDSIMTHNHPYEGESGRLYDTMAGRIGTVFSDTDVIRAVQFNLKEIRAVTPAYTYSIRRPQGGWLKDNVAKSNFQKDMESYGRRLRGRMKNYGVDQAYSSYKYFTKKGNITTQSEINRRNREVSDRANVGIQYSMMKELAKKYGWELTRRKVK